MRGEGLDKKIVDFIFLYNILILIIFSFVVDEFQILNFFYIRLVFARGITRVFLPREL